MSHIAGEQVRAAVLAASQRVEAAVRKPVAVRVQYTTFESSPHAQAALDVLAQHALDRVAGAIEWFCEWPSCQRILGQHMRGIDMAYADTDSPPRVVGSVLQFNCTFLSHTAFPQANTIAHVLDESFGLYRGRVYDIRQTLIPAHETRLREILGVPVDVRLNIEGFGLLDWEEDNFYNAYTQLVPSNAGTFFGRVPDAIAQLCENSFDKAKLQEVLRVVEIKLTLKDYKRMHLKDNRLKLAERFWNGTEHSVEDIKAYLTKQLHLGFDVNTWVREMVDDVVPHWTERLARVLGRAEQPCHIIIKWPSFASARDPVAAVGTLFQNRSALVLARILSAVQECVDIYPNARKVFAEELIRIRIKCCGTGPNSHEVTVRDVRDPLNEPKVYDQDQRRIPGAPGSKKYYGKKLVVALPFVAGEEGMVSVQAYRDALRRGFGLKAPVQDDNFFVTNLVQSSDRVELTGNITKLEMFEEVFKMMEGYSARTTTSHPTPAAAPSTATSNSNSNSNNAVGVVVGGSSGNYIAAPQAAAAPATATATSSTGYAPAAAQPRVSATAAAAAAIDRPRGAFFETQAAAPASASAATHAPAHGHRHSHGHGHQVHPHFPQPDAHHHHQQQHQQQHQQHQQQHWPASRRSLPGSYM